MSNALSLVSLDEITAKARLEKSAFTFKHKLADHPLFTLQRLVELAKAMPRDQIEYNSGKVAIGVKPEDVPKIDKSPEDVIRAIESENAWMVIKRADTDPAYKAVLETFVRDLHAAAGLPPDHFTDCQGFIFVSSANATTPFHTDAEENALIQIKGDKFVRTFDNDDRSLVSEEALEISPHKHRNLPYEDWFESRATLHALKPGEAVHMPYTIPHWVSTGSTYSISMAMTWKTKEVARLNKIRTMNGTLRRFGLAQRPPGSAPALDAAKVVLHDSVHLVLDPLRKSETMRRFLRGLIYGKNANYYLNTKPKQAGM